MLKSLFARLLPDRLQPSAHSSPVMTLVLGDIVEQRVDAIVNAADWTLLGGTGVDGAIHTAAGPELGLACRNARRLRTAEAWASPGFRLPARHIIHTEAPVYDRSGSDIIDAANASLLQSAYGNCLALATRMGLESIAFPALGAGAFGWPVAEVAEIALRSARDYSKRPSGLREIRFVAFDARAMRTFERVIGIVGVVERNPVSFGTMPDAAQWIDY